MRLHKKKRQLCFLLQLLYQALVEVSGQIAFFASLIFAMVVVYAGGAHNKKKSIFWVIYIIYIRILYIYIYWYNIASVYTYLMYFVCIDSFSWIYTVTDACMFTYIYIMSVDLVVSCQRCIELADLDLVAIALSIQVLCSITSQYGKFPWIVAPSVPNWP